MSRKTIEAICRRFGVGLCYLFGSQAAAGRALIEGRPVQIEDPESDIDFGVVFLHPPEGPLRVYALLSLEFGDLVSPYRADLLFLHEVDHLFQLEVIQGIHVYAISEAFREEYEERVMMFASDEYEIFKRNERDLFEAIQDGYFEFEYQADRR